MTKITAKPFLKWAGGKTQLLSEIENRLPGTEIKCFIEPFIGSGAVTLHLTQNISSLEQVIINDRNPELVLVWNVIKYHVKPLIRILENRQQEFTETTNKEVRKEIYYRTRTEFNDEVTKIDEINFTNFSENNDFIKEFCINRASQFIFLNRTCFNGLYRVNKKGQFNVPMGDYKNPLICDKENLMAVHELLNHKNVKILSPNDYTIAKEEVNNLLKHYRPNEIFMYFDPPYRPLSQSSSFTAYSKYDFNDEDQKKLAEFYHDMDEIGINVMLSNSDPTNTNENDLFFDDLFKKFGKVDEQTGKVKVPRVQASRNINSKGAGRGKINEILVTNYDIKEECGS
ncbi:MAG: DNA adenine methylase [Ectobacillus sp.]